MAGTPQNDTLKFLTPRAADLRSGKIVSGKSVPFDSVAEVLDPEGPYYTPKAFRYEGLTIEVKVGGKQQQWWFAGGVEDENFEPKNLGGATILVEVKAGTSEAIAAGVIVGSKTYQNARLAGNQCEVTRGSGPIAGIDLGGGVEYAIKDTDGTLNSDTINFLSAIYDGEYIKVKLA